jgi:tetratricopeptide (TPR) repeat protein
MNRVVFFVALLLLHPGDATASEKAWEKATAEGQKAMGKGDFAKAEQHFLRAVQEAEEFGDSDMRLADSLNVLADLYRAQGKYGEAEPLYRRRIAIMERSLGPEHVILGGPSMSSWHQLSARWPDSTRISNSLSRLSRC